MLPAVTESFCLEVWNRLNTIITVSLEKKQNVGNPNIYNKKQIVNLEEKQN